MKTRRPAPRPRAEPLTDPAALARMARDAAGTCTRTAHYFAGLCGLYAAKRGAAQDDCPFDDAAMAGAWRWYWTVGRKAEREARARATADMMQTMGGTPACDTARPTSAAR